MLELLERQQSLTINQWKIFAACVFATMLDFFDFFLISFVLAFFVRSWHLTYGETALILLSSGVASIPGGWFFGWLADRIGRRKVFIMTVLTFSIATGLMALTPSQGWGYLVAMRFIVGLGVGGMAPCSLTLIQEFVPTSKRGLISGLTTGLLPAGPLLAAVLSAFLGPVIGWRGLFAIGLLPALMALVIQAWVPESPRWLMGQGRLEEARRALAWALRMSPTDVALPAAVPVQAARAVVGVVPLPAQYRRGRPHRARADRRCRAGAVGRRIVRAGVAGDSGRGVLPDHLGQPDRDPGTCVRRVAVRQPSAAATPAH